MKFSRQILFATILSIVWPCFAQEQAAMEIPCRQATSVSMGKPDAVSPGGPLLMLNNRSWMKEGSEYRDTCVPLLEFDLSAIPPKSKVFSAVLRLALYGRGQTETRPVIKVYPISADWSAKAVTWNDKPSWDESFTEIEVPSQPSNTMDPWKINLTPLVQKWIDGDIENHGLAIVADSTKGDAHNFAFYNSAYDSARTPVLEITLDANAK